MDQHIKIIAVLFIVIGVLIGGVAFIFFAGAGIIGAVASQADNQEELGGLLIGGGCTTAVGIMFAVLALPNIIAGWGLLKRRNWARILAIVLAALNLPNAPLGTALGIYAMVILLNDESKTYFS